MTQPYKAAVTALGGRSGFAASSDGRLRVELSIPAVLGGADGPGTNPEQLFAAAQAASLLAAIRNVAQARGVEVPADSNVTATVGVAGAAGTAAKLSVAVAVDLPCIDIEEARQIVAEAMRACPIALATGERAPPVVNVD
ncbi:Ohr family peroxiredoxin [Novosphingobium kaempferiae]|uniref:Ohr family peroxiredoxin n=1 Tax=Novosphingobium kaempferiae TaxID=2896849 RepID=UPI001E370B1F|nr:Ohr family peroxiredoxin [Novosphingobium kaempferiae]